MPARWHGPAKSQALESEHLLKALLEQKDLAVRILDTAGVDVAALDNSVEQFLARQPKLGAPPDAISLGSSLDQLLDHGEKERQAWKDQFIAIEHLLLALCEDNRCGQIPAAGPGAGIIR